MISVFNLKDLQSLLEDFYRITHIRITVFDSDLNELVSYPEKCAPFCELIRSTQEGRASCSKCDQDACQTAAGRNKTYIYRCHAGLTEAVTPLYVGEVLVGYLLFGHIFSYGSEEDGWEAIEKSCEKYPVDLARLRRSCAECPHVSKDYIKSASSILRATASYLVLERMATLQEDSISAKLDSYLSAHYTEHLTSQILCRELNVGRSKLFKLSAQLYGCGVSQHIRKLRIERAKHLLLDSPELSISEVASDCGYDDYNYFIAVFSQMTGQPPNTYRKLRIKGKTDCPKEPLL